MTKLMAMAAPILKGKTEQWKKFASELNGVYKKEFDESRKKLNVQERSFLQTTPMGDFAIVTLQGEDPEAALKQLAKQNDEFTKWFSAQVKEIHGMDLNQISNLQIPQLVAETSPVEELAHH